MIISCSRNVVYNLSLTDLTEQRRLVWYSPENDVKMCVVKGKDEVRLSFQIQTVTPCHKACLYFCNFCSCRLRSFSCRYEGIPSGFIALAFALL